MKKIVLGMPNISNVVELNVRKDPPRGILYIASALRRGGYEVSVITAFVDD